MARNLITSIVILSMIVAFALIIGATGFDLDTDLIVSIRMPRVITAMFAGAATAVAGALSQSLFRNTLATPSIIGTEAGAAFALALATLVASTSGETLSHPIIFTIIGAGGATLISLRFARARADGGGLTTLLLGGFALNALFAAATSFCLSILMESGDGMSLYHWLMGSFSARTWDHAAGVMIGFFICVMAALRFAPSLDAMSLGDDTARSIGVNVPRVHRVILILIAALVGTSLSCGGALPFIGLIAPHFCRLIAKPNLRVIIPMSAITGAILTVSADLAARTLRAPVDMDVGILTTMIGAPYFLWLLASEKQGLSS